MKEHCREFRTIHYRVQIRKYDGSAEEAIAQIKTQEYFKRYAGQYRNIILVGINYSTITKDHQCLIERLN